MGPVKQGVAGHLFGEVQLGQRPAISCRVIERLMFLDSGRS